MRLASIISIVLGFLLVYGCSNKQDEARVDINANKNDAKKHYTGRTPLMGAARNGDIEIVKFHLARGADPNITDRPSGSTALDFAASNGHLEM